MTRTTSGRTPAPDPLKSPYLPVAGELVCCGYRLPVPWQYWLHEVHVGTVLEPSDDVSAWNGGNSERRYCDLCGRLPVAYGFSARMHEAADSLFPAPPGKGGSWMLRSEEEAWDLRCRSLALAGRYIGIRRDAAELALTCPSGKGSLSAFGRSRILENENHRQAALREAMSWLASLRPPACSFDEQSEYGQVRELIGILHHLPADCRSKEDEP